jgi:4'-phosphopantetheinyl transferase
MTIPIEKHGGESPGDMPPVRLWLRPLPVPEGLGVIEIAQARKRAAAIAVRERLLAELPDVDLAAIRRGANGKPYLPPPHEHVGFNPSDSGGWFLIGLVADAQIGVDLELRRPRPKAMAIAQRHFPAAEVAWLAAQDDPDHAFLRLWTLREALFKAIGRGLGYGLGKACFQPGADGRLILADLEGEAAPTSRWSVRELDLGDRHVGAAVWSGPMRPVILNAETASARLSVG